MKVGDYVRYYDLNVTEIGQIVGEVEDSEIVIVKDKEGECFNHNKNFIKSGSIIDVIEVGDYVNGECVYSRFETKLWLDGDTGEILIIDGEPDEPIKSIVTKEQFEKMEYKVGD